MGSVLDGDCKVNMGVDDRKRSNIFGVKLFGCFVVKNEAAFIAWLVVVLTHFFCASKIVIYDNLSMFLKNSKVCK
jgi:hypothetical protein